MRRVKGRQLQRAFPNFAFRWEPSLIYRTYGQSRKIAWTSITLFTNGFNGGLHAKSIRATLLRALWSMEHARVDVRPQYTIIATVVSRRVRLPGPRYASWRLRRAVQALVLLDTSATDFSIQSRCQRNISHDVSVHNPDPPLLNKIDQSGLFKCKRPRYKRAVEW